MTEQEAFDKVWDHFITKGSPQSITEMGSCMYRLGLDPKSPVRCAAGVLIPDDLYEAEMEGTVSGSVISEYPVLGDLLYGARDLIRDMQLVHDGCSEVGDGDFILASHVSAKGKTFKSFKEAMEFGLREVAKQRELKVPEAA